MVTYKVRFDFVYIYRIFREITRKRLKNICLIALDFLNKFEKSTGGENYKINKTNQANDKDKDDINAFMDELETFTSGENFKK